MIVVLDTNVFISGLRGRESAPSTLFTAWKSGHITLALSPALLAEIKRVLTYPKVQTLLKASDQDIDQALEALAQTALMVSGETVVRVIEADPTDNIVLSCAKEAHADVIVSGDTKHVLPLKVFDGIPIVSPAVAVSVIEEMRKKAA